MLVGLGITIFVRPITTLLHELGHAIAALVFYSGKVHVYVGSYGDKNVGKHLSIGRLHVHFDLNILSMNRGVCEAPDATKGLIKNMIFVAAGPFISILIIVVSAWFVFNGDFHSIYKIMLCIIIFSSAMDLRFNLEKNHDPIILANGKSVHNDGTTLRNLWENRNHTDDIVRISNLIREKKLQEVNFMFDQSLKFTKNKTLLRLGAYNYLVTGKHEDAINLNLTLKTQTILTSIDEVNLGISYVLSGDIEQAQKSFERALIKDDTNARVYLNQGYLSLYLEKFQLAVEQFKQGLRIDPMNTFGMANLFLAEHKLGYEDKESSIKELTEIFDLEPFAFRNLGIIQLEKGNVDNALKSFRAAKNIDPYIHQIDELIQGCEIE
ncbi:MAG: tetratricopeptide repeat protein [Flavobacteriales bacterium]